ncbi:SbcC/MukB-like Walker B domain-containing protein [Siminovitchia sediminis]|uniref:Nuclease SbcCD subunit C n=1 Tax=Siminovitchia sediminis TaxID=1274353 RepID=A0ABW4KD06_9BACI
MRPLQLTMQAFGPYAGEETIDFTQLENRTMFVISGKTGAGKTSIFDGISFAIYGKASGEDRMGSDLRSHFAKDDVPTEVSLTFQLKDQIYHIWRAPQQEKKKSRGEGYTIVNAKAELYILEDSGEKKLLAANVRETDEKIKEIIQLDANQFRQILMIPQGDFRKLLTSDSKEKEAILQRLFHTEAYKKIEDRLKDKAGLLKSEVESGIEQRSRLLKSVFTNGHEELEAALAEKIPSDTAVLPLLNEVTEDMKKAYRQLEKKIESKQKERDEVKRKVNEAENILNEMNTRDELKKKKSKLDGEKRMIDEKKQTVILARRAAHLEHQENICKRLKKEIDEKERKKSRLEETFIQTEQASRSAEEKLRVEEKNKSKREHLHAEFMRLDHLRDAVLSFSNKKADLLRLENDIRKYRSELEKGKIRVTEWEEKIDKEQKHLQVLRDLQDQNVQLKEELLRHRQLLNEVNQLDEILEKKQSAQQFLNQKEKELTLAQARANDAMAVLKQIEEKWHAEQAAILAKGLSMGEPCPVCGSSDHPSPASFTGSHISEDDYESAKKDVQRIERHLADVQQEWMKAKADFDMLNESAVEKSEMITQHWPEVVIESIPSLLLELQEKENRMAGRLQANTERTETIPKIESAITQLTKDVKELKGKLEGIAEKERTSSNEYLETRAALQSLTLHLPNGVQTKEQFDKRLTELQLQIKQYDTALAEAQETFTKMTEQLATQRASIESMREDIENIQSSLLKEREKFLEQLHQEGFSSYGQYTNAKKDERWIQTAEEEIKIFGEEFRAVTELLNDYEERLKEVDRPDMAKLEEAFKEQENILLALNSQYSGLMMNIRRNEEVQISVDQLNQQIKEKEKKYELIGHLSDITKGKNAFKLTFERYVLASFLDDILSAANHRLAKMTSGRYQLLRKKERSKGNVQSGLELLVFDQYTGQERHVKTLSGGESFKAALSLALGLADVVQEYAGGVSLETMFIDEGFGTLDPESLDQAIEALMEIQSTGRLVGIISHVPELKERIDARLEVKAGQSGSSTEFVFLS